MGPVAFDATDDPEPELIDALIRLHGARWREQGEPGMIALNRSEQFLRAVSTGMAREDLLRFFVLRFRDEVVAVILAFRYRNKIYAYMSAFDPDYESLGFGRTLLYEGFRLAYDEAYDAWNFLRGDEPYKVSWGGEPIQRCRALSSVKPEVIARHPFGLKASLGNSPASLRRDLRHFRDS